MSVGIQIQRKYDVPYTYAFIYPYIIYMDYR